MTNIGGKYQMIDSKNLSTKQQRECWRLNMLHVIMRNYRFQFSINISITFHHSFSMI